MDENQNFVDSPEMPMGLGMALAKNRDALNRFAALSPAAQQQVIAHTHSISSKKEMEQFANQIAQGGIG